MYRMCHSVVEVLATIAIIGVHFFSSTSWSTFGSTRRIFADFLGTSHFTTRFLITIWKCSSHFTELILCCLVEFVVGALPTSLFCCVFVLIPVSSTMTQLLSMNSVALTTSQSKRNTISPVFFTSTTFFGEARPHGCRGGLAAHGARGPGHF